MSGLAEILINLGYSVSGSDLQESEITERLKTLGARFFCGHKAEHLPQNSQMLVFSAAVDMQNPELTAARKLGIPLISRGELLADIMRLKKHAVAVAGAHGKTTSTSFIYHVMQKADIESTVIIGGILARHGSNALWGKGDYLVAETDEHDGSFLKLAPSVSVVTNIDAEHMEYYPNMQVLKKAFVDFIHKVPFYGFSVLCVDDPNVRSILPEVNCSKILYGFSEDADVCALNVHSNDDLLKPCTEFDVYVRSKRLSVQGLLGRVKIGILGEHNVQNALAAIATGLGLGIPFETIGQGLLEFRGIKRRMQVEHLPDGRTMIEDYAHHPTEIAAVLKSVRPLVKGRLIVAFQPHLYSRTEHFMDEFAKVLSTVDELLLLPIYPAREEPILGVDSQALLGKVDGPQKRCCEDFTEAQRTIDQISRSDDLVLILGAGDIFKLTELLVSSSMTANTVILDS